MEGQKAVVQDLESPPQKGASGSRLLDGSILTPDRVGMSSRIGACARVYRPELVGGLVLLPHLEGRSTVDEIGCFRHLGP